MTGQVIRQRMHTWVLILAVGLTFGALVSYSPILGVALGVGIPLGISLVYRPLWVVYAILAALVLFREETWYLADASIDFFRYQIGYFRPVELLVYSLAATQLLQVVFARRSDLGEGLQFISRYLVVFILAVIPLSMVVSLGSGSSLRTIFGSDEIRIFVMGIAFYFAMRGFIAKGYGTRILMCFIGLATLKSAFASVMYLAGHGEHIQDWVGTNVPYVVFFDGSELYIALFALMVILCYATMEKTARRNGLLFALPLVFSLIFSFRRNIWLALVVALCYMAIFMDTRSRYRIVVASILGFGMIAAIQPWFGFGWVNLLADRVVTLLGADVGTTNLSHLLELVDAFNAVKGHAIAGLGVGVFWERTLSGYILGSRTVNFVHDMFLDVWIKFGLTGLFLCVGMFGHTLFRLPARTRMADRPLTKALFVACGSFVCAVLTLGVFGPAFYFSIRKTLLLMMVFALLATPMREDAGERIQES